MYWALLLLIPIMALKLSTPPHYGEPQYVKPPIVMPPVLKRSDHNFTVER